VELRHRAEPVGAAENPGNAGKRAHDACRRNLADGVIAAVSYIDIARAVDGDTLGSVKARLGTGTVGASKGLCRTGQRAHDSGRRNPADGAVAGIGNQHVARAIQSNSMRPIKARGSSGIVGAPCALGRARHRAHRTGRRDSADGAVAHIGDINITGAADGNAVRGIKACCGPVAIDAAGNSDVPMREIGSQMCRRYLGSPGTGSFSACAANGCHHQGRGKQQSDLGEC